MTARGSLVRLAAAVAAHRGDPGRRFRPIVRARLLGRPRVSAIGVEGGPEVEVKWRLRRAFELVAFLGLAPGRWASDAAIGEALWPDADPDVVDRNLRPTVSDARTALSSAIGASVDTIARDEGGFALARSVTWQLDIDAFDADARLAHATASAAPDRALACGRRAWRRVRGRLLEGRDAPWIVELREPLDRRYRQLLTIVAEVALRVGDRETAIDAHRTVLVDDPYDESAHLALMEIYGHDRRPDLVRRQFMRLEDCLRELDVEPRETTRDRFLALVSNLGRG